MKKILANKKLMEVFWYVFFGGLTTVVNFVVYFLFRDVFAQGMLISNSVAWLMSVLFAFGTNKIWVFHSKTKGLFEFMVELAKFIFYRLLSYAMDMGSMFVLIEMVNLEDFWAKFFTQFIIVVANYVFSKLFIFKGKNE